MGSDSEKRRGLIQVYTGMGKGKTTAALGLALRASGKGHKVHIIQFMKGQIKYGELEAVKHLPGVEIEQFGRPDFVNKEKPEQIDIDLARKGFERAKYIINSGEHDLVVLDELNIAMDYKLLGEDEVIEMLKNRPEHVEVVLTGRYAPVSIVILADLVTEMIEIKHPYKEGVEAREGIEF